MPRGRRIIDWATVPDLGEVEDKVIADRLKCGRATVTQARCRLGIKSRRQNRTPDPDEVREMLANDVSRKDAAYIFDVSKTTIWNAIHR